MILFTTCRDYPEPTPSLAALLQALSRRGVEASLRIWTDTPIETFAAADLVLPICCWDYHAQPQRFADWIDALDGRGTRLVNDAEVLRWNLRKTYLLEMAADGLAIPKTVHLPQTSADAIEARMCREGWDRAILKPVSGQSGFGVQKLELDRRPEWSLEGYSGGEALLQAFQSDIGALGETTLTFIDGVFSHAIRRRLKPGEWRANLQYGATPEAFDPPPEVVEAARLYLDAAPQPPVYARVDGLARADGFMLMELELIEPYLYFEFVPGRAERMAQALVSRL